MNEAPAVEKIEHVERRYEELTRFVGAQRTVGQNLSQGLLGVFHHHEEELVITELAVTRVEQPQQVRMLEGGARAPPLQQ